MKQLKKGKIKGIVRAYGFPILFGIIFACVLVYFVRPSQIEGESMEPTLKDGQLIFCSAALKGRIEKGDIISAIISPKANVPKKYLLEDGKLLNGLLVRRGIRWKFGTMQFM